MQPLRQKSRYLAVGAALSMCALALAGYLLLRPRPANTVGAVLTENGYVELRPPSNLITPGAWIQVLGSDPLRLSIICEPKEALGLADPEQWVTSGSSAMTVEEKLAPKFSLDAGTLSRLKASAEFAPVRDVTFRLSNVKLVELPDAVVFKSFKQRTAECDQAIAFRLKQQTYPVSMIKSALIADVEYLVDFDGHIDAQASAKASSDLALELGAKLESSDTIKARLVGQGLVWGVRDDTVLATFGYRGTQHADQARSILAGHGPVVATEAGIDAPSQNFPQ